MNLFKKTVPITIIFILTALFILNLANSPFSKKPISTPQPAPAFIKVGDLTKVKYPQDFTLVLVGDSMIEALGNSDEIRDNFAKYYPQKSLEVLNYGFGSTNILSLQKRLKEKTFYGREFRAITEIDFDLILIESFGHNPLSDFPLDEGLKKQTEALLEAVQIIKNKNPQGKIVFLATIAPSRKNYARGQRELSDKERKQWANERIAYIKNHIKFAKDHNIPVINIFEKSIKEDGDLNLDYVRKEDYIHPSPKGVIFISGEIVDFIYQNKILE